MSTKKKHKKAAGTILFYNVKEENELIHIKNIKNKGSISKGINILFLETPGDRLDLPKGVADSIILKSGEKVLESNIECALRETREECNILIDPSELKKGSVKKIKLNKSNLTFFVLEINKSHIENISFNENPETAVIEHKSSYLYNLENKKDLKDISNSLLSFLKPAIIEAKKYLY